jgi:hypothetical protein
MEVAMKRVVPTVGRAVLLLAYLIGAQAFLSRASAIANQTYQYTPYVLCLSLTAILLGALLRCDVFFDKKRTFRIDWLSLLLIGIPSLLIAFSQILLFSLFQNVPIPHGFEVILFGDKLPIFGGVLLGYTVINSMFAVKGEN